MFAKMTMVLAVGALYALPAQAQLTKQQKLELGSKYTDWFYTAKYDSLRAHMDDGTKQGLTVERMGQQLAFIQEQAGTEVKLIEEKMVLRGANSQYWRESQFSLMEEPLVLRWVILDDGRIGGVGMSPKSKAPPVEPHP